MQGTAHAQTRYLTRIRFMCPQIHKVHCNNALFVCVCVRVRVCASFGLRLRSDCTACKFPGRSLCCPLAGLECLLAVYDSTKFRNAAYTKKACALGDEASVATSLFIFFLFRGHMYAGIGAPSSTFFVCEKMKRRNHDPPFHASSGRFLFKSKRKKKNVCRRSFCIPFQQRPVFTALFLSLSM